MDANTLFLSCRFLLFAFWHQNDMCKASSQCFGNNLANCERTFQTVYSHSQHVSFHWSEDNWERVMWNVHHIKRKLNCISAEKIHLCKILQSVCCVEDEKKRILISVLASDWGTLSRLIGTTSEARNTNGSLHRPLQKMPIIKCVHQQPVTRDHHLSSCWVPVFSGLLFLHCKMQDTYLYPLKLKCANSSIASHT